MTCFDSIQHCPRQRQVKKKKQKLDNMSLDSDHCPFFSLIKADREIPFSKPFRVCLVLRLLLWLWF